MKVTPSWTWDARSAGGVFVGVRWSFPTRCVDSPKVRLVPCSFGVYEVWGPWRGFWVSGLSIGFGLFRFHLNFEWGHEDWKEAPKFSSASDIGG
jgi:hypothetical protein